MRFEKVHIESIGHVLPDEITSSLELEQRIAPVYERLHVSAGRLELMSGIRERRFWPEGTRPSAVAARAGKLALERAEVERSRIGCLIHASVCRDFLEPATASVVHRALELPDQAQAFDLSNACLGFVNAMVLVAEKIEAGSLMAGMVVAGEDGGPLVRETIRRLLANDELTRSELKRAFASLTIGSGAAAAVLAHSSIATSPTRLVAASALAATHHVELCQGDHDPGAVGPWMETDSEALLHAGNELAARTFANFKAESGWTPDGIERVVTHQIGAAHRRLLFETLELDLERDFPTVSHLGNIGSVSLPLSYSMGLEAGFIRPGQRVICLGVGSGLQCQFLGLVV